MCFQGAFMPQNPNQDTPKRRVEVSGISSALRADAVYKQGLELNRRNRSSVREFMSREEEYPHLKECVTSYVEGQIIR